MTRDPAAQRRVYNRVHKMVGVDTMRLSLLLAAMLLIIPGAAFAQPSGETSTVCPGESEAVSLSVVPIAPQVLFEIELTVVNKTTGKIHLDPGQMTLLNDQGEQAAPLTAEQAKSNISNPGQSFWSLFWFGWIGYATNQSKQAELMKQVDARILTMIDLQPGVTHKGSLFFKLPNPKADQFTLVVDGLSADSSASVRVNCAFPKGRSTQSATTPPAVRTYALALRATSGPIAVNLSKMEFAKDSTTLEVTIENAADVEANLFFAKTDTVLTDANGKSYALRFVKTEIGDSVAPHSSIRGTLVFEVVPRPPLTTSVTLTMPGIRVGEAAYEVKVIVPL